LVLKHIVFLKAMNAYKEYIDPEQSSVYGKIINDISNLKIMSRIFRNFVSELNILHLLVNWKVPIG